MPLRSFFAIDNANLVVTSSTNGGLVGNGVINNSDTPNGTVFLYSGGGGTTVTLNDTGGGGNRFNDDRASDHVITNGGGIVSNGTEVEAESLITLRALDGSGNPTGPTITITVFSQNGQTSNVWGFSATSPLQPGTSYVKTGGSNDGTSNYNTFVACFGPGTLIETPDGARAIEQVKAGDSVWTRQNGPQPVRWIGSTEVDGVGAFAPVFFAPGVIGNDQELVVSQQHRMFLQSAAAEMLFGAAEVLVAAKHLCGLPGVSLRSQPRIRYTHLMFDRHQVVRANGALTESFFLTAQSLDGIDQDHRNELLALFPSLNHGIEDFGSTAALTLKATDAGVLCAALTQTAGSYSTGSGDGAVRLSGRG